MAKFCGTWLCLLIIITCVQQHNALSVSPGVINEIQKQEGDLFHPCARQCLIGKTMTCVYNFTIEWYMTLSKACHDCPFNKNDCSKRHCVSADGATRPIITINRQIPGPTIFVCEGDRVVVWVMNHLDDGETTSIHWHGIHQVGTPYMDGVGQITQCPIGVNEKFKYDFIASPPGTHWYHSHIGVQSADGLNGAIIVRQPPGLDPNADVYNREKLKHFVVVNDWPVTYQTAMVQNLFMMHNNDEVQDMSGSVNGKRRHFNVTRTSRTPAQTPLTIYKVYKSFWHRFRFIGANANCPFMISVQDHKLTVIAVDGSPVFPRVVDYFIMNPGERYDMVLIADQPKGNYWMKMTGLGRCYKQGLTLNAIIRYYGARKEDPPGPQTYLHKPGVMLNPAIFDMDAGENQYEYGYNQTWIQSHKLRYQGHTNRFTKIDVKLYIGTDFLNNNLTPYNYQDFSSEQFLPSWKSHLTPTIDNITFNTPPVPVLSQPEDVDESWFCNRSTVMDPTSCPNQICLCTHVIRLPLNATVEVVLFDVGRVSVEPGHSMHLHGYNFKLLGRGQIGTPLTRERIMQLDEQGNLTRVYYAPSIRDTVNVPRGGYVIIRFKADNPGFWLFDSHTEGNLRQGKALLFKVGEYSDLPPVPKQFARCGGYGFSSAQTRTNDHDYNNSTDGSGEHEYSGNGDLDSSGAKESSMSKEKCVSSISDGSHTKCAHGKFVGITLMTLWLFVFCR